MADESIRDLDLSTERTESPLDQEEESDDGKEDSEDYDFDFTVYEGQDDDEEVIESILEYEKPPVSGMRSRFSMGESEFDRIADLRKWCSKWAIEVEARTQDIPTLWKFYGVLSEIWELTRNIYGKYINDEITRIKNTCRIYLEECKAGRIVHKKVHNNLLFFRHLLYTVHQLSNLSIEVERTNRKGFSRAARKIIE